MCTFVARKSWKNTSVNSTDGSWRVYRLTAVGQSYAVYAITLVLSVFMTEVANAIRELQRATSTNGNNGSDEFVVSS